MKDSDFELLIASVKEAGRIKRGEIEPARKFTVNVQHAKTIRPKLNKP